MAPETFPGIEVHHKGGHYAILDAGAQVVTWTPPGQNPVLWVSPLATFEAGSALRGGVPVVFPWFGAGVTGDRTPSHGFARTSTWARTSVVDDMARSGVLEVRHTLDDAGFDSPPFLAELVATFSASELRVSLQVTNTGPTPLHYEEALHSYFAVGDVGQVSVDGLDGCPYFDKVAGSDGARQDGPVRFTGETDRVYRHSGPVSVEDRAWGRTLHIDQQGSRSTVVWNPGPDKGSALADVGAEWSGFVCVEAGNVREEAVELAPGEQHTLAQAVTLS